VLPELAACLSTCPQRDHLRRALVARRRRRLHRPDQIQVVHLVSFRCGRRARSERARSEHAAGEVRDQLRRRGVKAHEVEHELPPTQRLRHRGAATVVGRDSGQTHVVPPLGSWGTVSPLSVHLQASARRSMQSVIVRFMSRAPLRSADVFHATRLPFDPGSTATGCAFTATIVLRGGALEPDPDSIFRYLRELTPTVKRRVIFARKCSEPFSLKRGLNSTLIFPKLGITLSFASRFGSKNDEGRPFWVALARAAMRLVA
jgi:hypothetical protein